MKYFTTRDKEKLTYDPDRSKAVTWRVCRKSNGRYGEFILFGVDLLVNWYLQGKCKYPELVNTIAHECTHAALDVFADCDVYVTSDDQEPLAYLIGKLSEYCMDYINDITFKTNENETEGTILCP